MTKKAVHNEIMNLTAPEEGKKRRKSFDPALLSSEALIAIVKAYSSKSKRKRYSNIIDLSTKEGVAKYFDIPESYVTKALDYVVTHPFCGAGNMTDVMNIIRTSSSNEKQKFPVSYPDDPDDPKNKEEDESKKKKKRVVHLDGLTQSERRYIRLLKDRREKLTSTCFDNREKVYIACKDYLRQRYSFAGTASANGWSPAEFSFLVKFASCVILSDRRFISIMQMMLYDTDYVLFLNVYPDVLTFREKHADVFKQLSELHQRGIHTEEDQKALEEFHKTLYEYFTAPDAFVPKEEAPAETAETAE